MLAAASQEQSEPRPLGMASAPSSSEAHVPLVVQPPPPPAAVLAPRPCFARPLTTDARTAARQVVRIQAPLRHLVPRHHGGGGGEDAHGTRSTRRVSAARTPPPPATGGAGAASRAPPPPRPARAATASRPSGSASSVAANLRAGTRGQNSSHAARAPPRGVVRSFGLEVDGAGLLPGSGDEEVALLRRVVRRPATSSTRTLPRPSHEPPVQLRAGAGR